MLHRTFVSSLSAVSVLVMIGCGGSEPLASSQTPGMGVEATASDGGSARASAGGRAGSIGVVYVTSQGLYYDTFVAVDPLPMKGPFQRLANGQTEFGPGDPGYLGGRWWEDTNANGTQDAEDHFFLCPLLPPGRQTP